MLLRSTTFLKYRHIILLSLLVGICFIVRFRFLSLPLLSFDEAFSIYYSQLSFQEIWRFLIQGNNPPLWEVILKIWNQCFGFSIDSARRLSALFSSLTLVPFFLISLRISKNTSVAVFSSLLFVLSNFQQYTAQEARVYSLVCFLSCWSFFLFSRLIEKKHSSREIIAWIVVNTLILYAHYTAYFVPVIQLFYIWIFKKQLHTEWVFKAFTSMFILALPIEFVCIQRFFVIGSQGTWIPPVKSLDELFYLLSRLFNSPVQISLSLCFFSFSILSHPRFWTKKENVLCLLWLIVPIISLYTLSFYKGIFHDKYLNFCLPAFYILFAQAIFILRNKWLQAAISLFVIFLSIYDFQMNTTHLKYHGERLPMKQLSMFIQQNRPHKFIIDDAQRKLEFLYYYDLKKFKQVKIESEPNVNYTIDSFVDFKNESLNTIEYDYFISTTLPVDTNNWKYVSEINNTIKIYRKIES